MTGAYLCISLLPPEQAYLTVEGTGGEAVAVRGKGNGMDSFRPCLHPAQFMAGAGLPEANGDSIMAGSRLFNTIADENAWKCIVQIQRGW